MRKLVTALLVMTFFILAYFTFTSAERVVRSDWQEPLPLSQVDQQHRLVLITQDIDTPFWDAVAKGARSQAEQDGAIIEILGNYGHDEEDFLRNLELAIHSKVDGIIVQGLDTVEFKELTKVKAAFYSIPIITIANDVPMEESLRRTYVGSPQYEAGQMLAEQLVKDMGESGEIILFYDQKQHYYQEQRREGMESVLKRYPDITVIPTATTDVKDDIVATTQELLNDYPNIDGFIAVNANIAPGMIQEISRRRQVESVYIYTFDDHAEILPLLRQGKLDAVIGQAPEEMGRLSVQLIVEWLNGETVPLDFDGYFTDITILKAADVR
ncbi:ribose transport system substrate-binding protein [Evansella caseinilytica]|uniref:Ribose transport system substrate-binding protein n=1 Tax=Evansella caseinilytica TaxID=1503961 RepID=A0A1H3FXG3_9BACI|nr:substrate-binding domain-containing protein [Evansella caseinilytica]SDX95772.1 ribose transport system substrate-binding protein [Evansella caseinilytica]